jgi:hypothetical protein
MVTQRSAIGIALTAGALALAGAADAAVTTVYKCFDRNLGVVYTDEPCRGEQLRIEGGHTDPVAIAELQREREAVARSAAQRVADLRARPEPVQQYAYAGPPPLTPDYGYADSYYPAYGYGPYYNGYNNDRGRGRPDDGRPDNGRRERQQYHVPAPKGNLIKR